MSFNILSFLWFLISNLITYNFAFLFIHLLVRYLLSAFRILSTVLKTRVIEEAKVDTNSLHYTDYILVEDISSKNPKATAKITNQRIIANKPTEWITWNKKNSQTKAEKE